jgi:hypothetical protein
MTISKSTAAIVVAFVTGLSPLGVILGQGWLEQRQLETGEINTAVLLNHGLFTHSETWLSLVIPQLQVSDTAREFLRIKFEAFQDSLESLVENTDFNVSSDQQLHALLSRNLNETVENYIADARRAGISDDFISSFSTWHQRVVDILVQSIEANAYSVVHSSQNAKMYAILTAYDSALGATIADVEKTLEASGG